MPSFRQELTRVADALERIAAAMEAPKTPMVIFSDTSGKSDLGVVITPPPVRFTSPFEIETTHGG